MNKKKRIAWNKGLTKEIDERVMKYALTKVGKKRLPFSKEWRDNISKSNKGLKRSKESKERYRLSRLGNKNPMYGKKGKLSPNWNGGVSFGIWGREFNEEFKEKVRQRDNRICMFCGKHEEQGKKKLCVHHINYNPKLSILENCIGLCHGCHIGVHNRTIKNKKILIKLFFNLLSERYGYNYENNEIILEVIK